MNGLRHGLGRRIGANIPQNYGIVTKECYAQNSLQVTVDCLGAEGTRGSSGGWNTGSD
ncbi:MAG: hypothetical protein OHK0012_26790 [Synechococcales cyanobacterium]